MTRLSERRPLVCCITGGQASTPADLLPFLERAAAAGLDLLQLRERQLAPRDLLAVAGAAVARARAGGTRVLLNDRLDVALAAGADGVQLPARGLPAAEVRNRFPDLLLGASCHNLDELRRAEESGADFTLFGPVFAPLSKPEVRPPLGVENLAEGVRAVGIPVLALGGVTLANAAACLAAGAAGVAAIALFREAPDLPGVVAELRRAG